MANPYHKENGEFTTAVKAGKTTALNTAALKSFDDFENEKKKQEAEETIVENVVPKNDPLYLFARKVNQDEIDLAAGGSIIPTEKVVYKIPEAPKTKRSASGTAIISTGSRHIRGAALKDIRENISNEIEEAKDGGYLPKHLKYKVYGGGIDVKINVKGASDEQIYENELDGKLSDRKTNQITILKYRLSVIADSHNSVGRGYDEKETFKSFNTIIEIDDKQLASLREAQTEQSKAKKANKAARSMPTIPIRKNVTAVQAMYVPPGSITTSGEKVLSVVRGARTPTGKVEVTLERRDGTRRRATWGSYTKIGIYQDLKRDDIV